jgi:hypothetical protein
MGDKQSYNVHRYRVQSEEKLQQRPVWRSIYSAGLGWEVLRLDPVNIDVHWESIVRRGLIRHGVIEEKQVTQSKDIPPLSMKDFQTCTRIRLGTIQCVIEAHSACKAKASGHDHGS